MRYSDVKTGRVFYFEDNFEHPKMKLSNGHIDVRDGVTGYMPDDIPVLTTQELSVVLTHLSALEQVARELDILLKWEAGMLSEGQASKLLGVDRLKARTMKMDALAVQLGEMREGE